jgi:TIR domain
VEFVSISSEAHVPYVSGVDNDIFVSYAHADNQADDGDGWVTRFVKDLNIALIRRLGDTKNLRIYFDDKSLLGHHDLESLVQNVRRSALLLSIVSPSYVRRDWTMKELDAFLGMPSQSGRTFLVETLPLDSDDDYPKQIANLKRTLFWSSSTEKETPMTLDVTLERDREKYRGRIEDLANQMRRRLMDLKNGGIPSTPVLTAVGPVGSTASIDRQKTVLLAQVTDDLAEECEQVRRYIEQFKFNVLPSVTCYPQGGEQFRAAFQADCQKCAHFVQLVGPVPSRRPVDLPQGYSQFQYETAKQLGLKVTLWRRSELDISTLNHADAALLKMPEIMVSGLEGFKDHLLKVLQEEERAEKSEKPTSDSFVFINADKDDREIAVALSEEFGRHNYLAFRRTNDGTAEEISKNLEENILECTALVLVYGSTSPTWVQGQIRLFTKLKNRRAQPPKVLAIYTGPPAPKPDIGVVWPNARQFDCSSQMSVEPVRKLITELLQ